MATEGAIFLKDAPVKKSCLCQKIVQIAGVNQVTHLNFDNQPPNMLYNKLVLTSV